METLKRARSFGTLALGIRVVSDDGRHDPVSTSLVRWARGLFELYLFGDRH